jgi:putative methionine-R-sulfoxide reductase with GAF domain
LIPFGKGVCGAAAATRETQLVEDVHQFPGHIACDSASNSEIVVPLVKDDVNESKKKAKIVHRELT